MLETGKCRAIKKIFCVCYCVLLIFDFSMMKAKFLLGLVTPKVRMIVFNLMFNRILLDFGRYDNIPHLCGINVGYCVILTFLVGSFDIYLVV